MISAIFESGVSQVLKGIKRARKEGNDANSFDKISISLREKNHIFTIRKKFAFLETCVLS